MNKSITVGILGGGQLARMSSYAARRLGFDVAILEKEKNSPAGQITKNEFIGLVSNHSLLKKFASGCDVVTLENEFVDYHHLEFLEKQKVKVFPSSKTVFLIQDKLIQKQTLEKKKIPVANFIEVKHKADFPRLKKLFGLPFILKSRKMGYDGYGNALIKNAASFEKEFDRLTHRHSKLLAEEFIHFKKELAVMVARTKREIKVYPVVETIQRNHICHTVIAPAKVSNKIHDRAKSIAVKCVEAVNGIGIFGIELFLSDDNDILVNEIAPRPHNSGHYTIEGCITSQFENHIRAVLNLPLGSVEMVKPFAVMINLLGKKNGGTLRNYSTALNEPNVHLHVYGKHQSRIGRKMGHITIVGDDSKKILLQVLKKEKEIII